LRPNCHSITGKKFLNGFFSHESSQHATIVASRSPRFSHYCCRVQRKNRPRLVAREVARQLGSERLRRGISMTQLAQRAGLSRQMVSYVESGARNPTLDTLLRISNALDIDLGRLINRASKMPKIPSSD
jgi:DNA-binding phage protein